MTSATWRLQLEEEIRLWWRTDELHQFKPSVLDEVDTALHYFQQVLFDAMPCCALRIHSALAGSYPDVRTTAGCLLHLWRSWVGLGSRWQPSVTRTSPGAPPAFSVS